MFPCPAASTDTIVHVRRVEAGIRANPGGFPLLEFISVKKTFC